MAGVINKDAERAPASGRARPWRLSTRSRKALLLIHIASAGSWIGIDIVMGILIFTSMYTSDQQIKAISYQALGLFVVWSLLVVGFVCLVSGIVLGLGTKYGLVRYWWVTAKLALNLLLTALVLIALRGEVTEKVEEARRFLTGVEGSLPEVGQLIFPPIVSPTLLVIAMILAVFKPWGRIRKNSAPRGS